MLDPVTHVPLYNVRWGQDEDGRLVAIEATVIKGSVASGGAAPAAANRGGYVPPPPIGTYTPLEVLTSVPGGIDEHGR